MKAAVTKEMRETRIKMRALKRKEGKAMRKAAQLLR
jgi:hypothetical protein